MKKSKEKGALQPLRISHGNHACYGDIPVKGTGDRLVRKGLQYQDIFCGRVLRKLDVLWACIAANFSSAWRPLGGSVLEKGPLHG